MEQEIIKRNKVIAEFMGAKFHKAIPGHFDADAMIFSKDNSPNPYNGEIVLTSLKYHSDWSWIMPVWIKFRKLWVGRTVSGVIEEREYLEWLRSLEYNLFSSDEPGRFAERLYHAILWYNSQVKETIKP